MSACYRYPKWYVLMFHYGPFLALPIAMFIFSLAAPTKTPFDEKLVILLISCTPFVIVPLVLLMNNYSISIWVADGGIIYRSLFKKLEMKWSDIRLCQWNALFDLGVAKGSDYFEIISVNNKVIRVFPYIMNCETKDLCEGIQEFESVVKNYVAAVKHTTSEQCSSNPEEIVMTSRDDTALTKKDRKIIIAQMIIFPVLCLSMVQFYFIKDIQKTAELVAYGTLLFLPLMFAIRRMVTLESQGKLRRITYVLIFTIGWIYIYLIYWLFEKREHVTISILAVVTVEVMMYMFYVTLKKGARIVAPPGNPLEKAAGDRTGISST